MAVPLIIAHRGASAEAPENTLAAFRRALALGVDGIELDVRTTRDGVPVVFHDVFLRRLTGRPGRLAAHDWSELRRLRVGGAEPIPRLADALALTRGRAVVQIELKHGVSVASAVRAVASARADAWVIFASFETALVKNAAELAPHTPRMLISEGKETPAALLRQLTACRANGLSIAHRAVRSAKDLRHFQARGFAVWCWTVNDPRLARRLAGWGVDGLVGDSPALLKRAV